MLILLGALASLCAVLSQYDVRADEKKTETSEDALGQDWRSLRDALDTTFDKLAEDADIKPSGTCDDDTFLRRVYLDLVGRPPGAAEIEAFRPGSSKDVHGNRGDEKRAYVVESLLASDEHAEYFAAWWTTLAIGRDADGNSKRYLRRYLHEGFAENRPWSKMVYDMVAGQGRTSENPEVGYIMSFQNRKPDMAGNTSKVFLGKQIQCAECHDHPYEDTTMDDFEGMEAFFRLTRTGARGSGSNRYWYTDDKIVHNKHDASNKVRMKGDYLFPTYLGRETWQFENKEKSLRESLGEWMTGPDNTWFREMTVNRYMDYFLGAGFVVPVDDFNSFNVPTFPVVLDQMGKDFAASGFDTRYLIRAIVNSKIYQRSVKDNRTNRDDFKYYSRAHVRRLNPEQIERSIRHAVGIERLNPTGPVPDVPDKELTDQQKKDKRTGHLKGAWSRKIDGLMRNAYGNDPETRDLDDYGGTIVEALMFLNADLFGHKDLRTIIDVAMEDHTTRSDRVAVIFKAVLGRRPDRRDAAILRATALSWSEGNDRQVCEDLFTALMCTTEFTSNH